MRLGPEPSLQHGIGVSISPSRPASRPPVPVTRRSSPRLRPFRPTWRHLLALPLPRSARALAPAPCLAPQDEPPPHSRGPHQRGRHRTVKEVRSAGAAHCSRTPKATARFALAVRSAAQRTSATCAFGGRPWRAEEHSHALSRCLRISAIDLPQPFAILPPPRGCRGTKARAPSADGGGRGLFPPGPAQFPAEPESGASRTHE
jgi:hypothetical protein